MAIRESAVMPERPLTNKQRAFCREYVKDSNGTQASIRAGYSKTGAVSRGSELLTFRKVQNEIARIIAGIQVKVGWSVEVAVEMLLATRQRAILNNQPAVEVSSVVAINRMFGLDQDNQIGGLAPESISDDQASRWSDMAAAANQERLKGPKLAKEAV